MANVKDFGTVGDGITDDSAAIQRAIDHAARDNPDAYPRIGLETQRSPRYPEEPLLPFDNTCPHCNRTSDLGEVFEGSAYRCKQCRKLVVAYVWWGMGKRPDTMCLGDGETWPESRAPRLTGRARTRARWRRQGRR